MLEKAKNPQFWQEVRSNPKYNWIVDRIKKAYEENRQDKILNLSYYERVECHKTGVRTNFDSHYFSRRTWLATTALLALIYPEAIPALWVGCMLSNITSPYMVYDVFLGALATLLAAFVTYMVGRFVKNTPLKIILGGLPVVLFNAAIIPLIIVFLCGGSEGFNSAFIAYLTYAGSIALTEAVWVYALGTPLYFTAVKLKL